MSSAILPGLRAPKTALNFHAHLAQYMQTCTYGFKQPKKLKRRQTSGAGWKTKHSGDTEKAIVTGDPLLTSTGFSLENTKSKVAKAECGFNHPQKSPSASQY